MTLAPADIPALLAWADSTPSPGPWPGLPTLAPPPAIPSGVRAPSRPTGADARAEQAWAIAVLGQLGATTAAEAAAQGHDLCGALGSTAEPAGRLDTFAARSQELAASLVARENERVGRDKRARDLGAASALQVAYRALGLSTEAVLRRSREVLRRSEPLWLALRQHTVARQLGPNRPAVLEDLPALVSQLDADPESRAFAELAALRFSAIYVDFEVRCGHSSHRGCARILAAGIERGLGFKVGNPAAALALLWALDDGRAAAALSLARLDFEALETRLKRDLSPSSLSRVGADGRATTGAATPSDWR